jgi:hypothetical protein
VKKLVLLLLSALMALAPVAVMAEAAPEVAYTTYQNETNGYTIDYPEDWTLLSKETVQSVMDSLANGGMQIEGMDTSVLEAYKAQIESMDMAMFMSADSAVGVSIAYQAVPAKIASADILAQYPAVLEQLQKAYQDYKELAEPKIETVGACEFVTAAGQYSPPGTTIIMLQAYHCTDTTLYTITYTINASKVPDVDALAAISDAMLASFIPA